MLSASEVYHLLVDAAVYNADACNLIQRLIERQAADCDGHFCACSARVLLSLLSSPRDPFRYPMPFVWLAWARCDAVPLSFSCFAESSPSRFTVTLKSRLEPGSMVPMVLDPGQRSTSFLVMPWKGSRAEEWPHAVRIIEELVGYGLWRGCRPERASFCWSSMLCKGLSTTRSMLAA